MTRPILLHQILIYIAAITVALAVLGPPAWLVISSISSESELLNVPVHWIPQEPTFDRYRQVIYATGSDSAAVFRR